MRRLFLALALAVATAGSALTQGVPSGGAPEAVTPDAATPAASAAPAAPAPILIARQLAESERLQVGQIIRMSPHASGADARSYRIQGIFEPTPDPAKLGTVPRRVRMHLPDLLAATPDGRPAFVESVTVGLANPADGAAFSRDLGARMPGLSVRPTSDPEAGGPFVVLQRFHLAIAIVTIIAATVFLLALTIMLVEERRATVGVLRLIGLPTGRIIVQLLVEGVLIAGLGAVFGLLLAGASERFINLFFQWKYDTVLVFVHVTREVAARCVAIAVPLGVVSTVTASWLMLRSNGLRLARR